MYGLVNRSIEDLIVTRFGALAWERICAAAGVQDEMFLTNESYPDATTYQLVAAASQVLGLPAEQILETFGEHWVLKTAQESYGAMLDNCGVNLADFLRNLNNLHSRVTLLLPKLQPPHFSVTEVTATSLVLHHRTHRQGLAPFTIGLVKGLGRKFKTPVTVTQIAWRSEESNCDSFRVEWAAPGASA